MSTAKIKFNKIFALIGRVLTYIFFLACLFLIVFCVTVKKDDDGAVNFFGTQFRVVVSNSMEKNERTDVSEYKIKSIPVKSMIFIDLKPSEQSEKEEWYSKLKVGDVLTFRYYYYSPVTITHRIIKITEKEGGYLITLRGDNESSSSKVVEQIIDTTQENGGYVVGKVTGHSYFLGVMSTTVKKPVFIICIIIVPCLVILGLEIMRLITIVKSDDKKENEKTKNQKGDF